MTAATTNAQPAPDLEALRDREAATAVRVLHAARASGRARHALDGERGGEELNNRIRAMVDASQALAAAIDTWMTAEAALAEAVALSKEN